MSAPGRRLGDLTILRALEMTMPFDRRAFFPGVSDAQWAPYLDWLAPNAYDPARDALIFPMQSYVVRTSHHTVLIDTCVGNHKDRPSRPQWHQKTDATYLRALAAQTRRAFLERCCDTPTLVCTGHFPLPSAGRIVRRGDAFEFVCDPQDW